MALILESLFVPGHKERISRGLSQRRYNEFVNGAAGAVAVYSISTGLSPVDTLRIIRGAAVVATPGAAQFPTYISINHARAGFVQSRCVEIPNPALPANALMAATFNDIDWMLFPRDGITIEVRFNAGVAANQADLWVWGFDMPRGNVEL